MIESVSAIGIGPFKRPLELPVGDLGLVLVRGDNRVSAAMDQNGVGKTALFSFALSWGLYGETLAGERGDDVLNRFSKGPGVVEVVGHDPVLKRRWKVIRGRRPKRVEAYEWDDRSVNSAGDPVQGWARVLEEADDRDVNAWVEDRYVPWRVFRNAVVFDRDVRFTRQDQGEALRILDRIQGVDFRAALDRAKAWRDGIGNRLEADRSGASRDAALLGQARVQVVEMERLRDGFAESKSRRLEEADAAVGSSGVLAREAERRMEQARVAASKAVAAREELTRIEGLIDVATEATTALRRAEEADERDEAQSIELFERVETLVKAGLCAACRRPVKDAASVSAGFREDVDAAAERRKVARAERKQREKAEREAVAVCEKALGDRDIDTLERTVRALEIAGSSRAVADAERALNEAREREAAALNAREAIRAERWDGAAGLRVASARVDEQIAVGAEAERRVAQGERLLRVAEYWVEAFGDRGLRSLLFDEVAGFLTERAAVHLEALAAGEVSLPFSATSATKGGATRERLSITPDWTWGGKGQAAESGGQNSRSDLAVFAALQDLVEARSARPVGLRVYDEVDGLDARGQELFGAWLKEQAQQAGSCFVMTHNPALAQCVEADAEWVVVLDAPGDARLVRER